MLHLGSGLLNVGMSELCAECMTVLRTALGLHCVFVSLEALGMEPGSIALSIEPQASSVLRSRNRT